METLKFVDDQMRTNCKDSEITLLGEDAMMATRVKNLKAKEDQKL